MRKIMCIALFLFIANDCLAVDFPDPLKGYKGQIKEQDTNAQHGMIYEAWGNNMANRIVSGKAHGVVVDNNGVVHGEATVTGAGNMIVERGAKVNGPIINLSTNRDATVVTTGK